MRVSHRRRVPGRGRVRHQASSGDAGPSVRSKTVVIAKLEQLGRRGGEG